MEISWWQTIAQTVASEFSDVPDLAQATGIVVRLTLAAMLGGLGSLPGALVGGIVLGTLEALAGGLISSHFKDAVAFCVLLLTLFIRPAGLLGRGSVERV